MSDTMTKEQEQKVKEYGDLMLKNGITHQKVTKKSAQAAAKFLYEKIYNVGTVPQVKIVASPTAAIKDAVKRSKGTLKATDINDLISYTNLYTGWVAYYHAGINILGETSGVEQELIDLLNEYESITRTIHAVLPFDDICYVIEHPTTAAIKDNDLEAFKLHREGGLAVEYRDGTGFAWLNGIEVPDYVATTPPSKLSAKKLMAETNVDVRREGLRRMKPTKVLKDIGAKLLDKVRKPKIGRHYDYELYDADFKDGKVRRLLKMYDVGSNAYTIERVEDDCDTVVKALAMRDGEDRYINPSVRT